MRHQIGNLILFMVFMIALLSFLSVTRKPKLSIAYSSFILLVLSFLFRAINLVPDLTVLIVVLLIAVASFVMIVFPDA